MSIWKQWKKDMSILMSEILDNEAERLESKKKAKAELTKEREKIRKRLYYQSNKARIDARNKAWYNDNKQHNQVSISLKRKLTNIKRNDSKNNQEFNLTEQSVYELLQRQEYKCKRCNLLLKLVWHDKNDPLQVSLNRLDINAGHNAQNIEVVCYSCYVRPSI